MNQTYIKLLSISTLLLLLSACSDEKKDPVIPTSIFEHTLWSLQGYGYGSAEKIDVLISSTYTLNFQQKSSGVGVKNNCENTISGYNNDATHFTFTKGFIDTKECTLSPSTVYQTQHTFILDVLNASAKYTLDDTKLVISTDEDKNLYFTKVTNGTPKNNKLQELKAFQSDGCSSFPDGTLFEQNLWLGCCETHDYEYWKGGTSDQKEQSDKDLESCVSKVGEPTIAALMLTGVTIGGSPYIPTSYRWGYGWPYPKGYGKLTKIELQQIEELSY